MDLKYRNTINILSDRIKDLEKENTMLRKKLQDVVDFPGLKEGEMFEFLNKKLEDIEPKYKKLLEEYTNQRVHFTESLPTEPYFRIPKVLEVSYFSPPKETLVVDINNYKSIVTCWGLSKDKTQFLSQMYADPSLLKQPFFPDLAKEMMTNLIRSVTFKLNEMIQTDQDNPQ